MGFFSKRSGKTEGTAKVNRHTERGKAPNSFETDASLVLGREKHLLSDLVAINIDPEGESFLRRSVSSRYI